MRTTVFLLFLSSLIIADMEGVSLAGSKPTDTGKVGPDQGLTLENIGRGIKSAARNIEEEIPKIGPAIGDTFKKVTGSDRENSPPKTAPPTSVKPKK